MGYDGTVPIIGIAIGLDIRTSQTGVETERGVYDVIDKSSNMSVDHGEAVILHRRTGGGVFLNGKLTVAQIAADRITGAGKMGRKLHRRGKVQMDRRIRRWPPAE